MKTKVIESSPAARKSGVLLYENRREDGTLEGVMLFNEVSGAVIILFSVFNHLPVGSVQYPNDRPGRHKWGSWTRIDGPITIQFNAP